MNLDHPPTTIHPTQSGLRGVFRITAFAIGSATIVAFVAAVGVWIFFGSDIPAVYERKVKRVEKRFSDGFPQGQIVLTGSAFFEYWSTSEADLAPLTTINVGVGGTKIGDQAAYVDRLVVPLQPGAVVVYAGSNDINGIPLFSKSGSDVAQRVRRYLEENHRKLPAAQLFYVAITEAPVKRRVRIEIQQANKLIAKYASSTDYVTFIDTAPGLLTRGGDIDASLFGPDRLHFNDSGYERFASLIRPVLLQQLKSLRVSTGPTA